ncbi:hypothetical protein JHK87_006114 [Glycine soja]|nr:hypothetical protein JHK87_006114 [Glycine soja]
MELKPAKFNLNRTTSDIADVRASVESLSKKLEKERLSLEKTRERLAQNSSKICSLEEELNQTKLKLLVAKDTDSDNHSDITRELQRLSFEQTMSEIEQTKAMIKTAEIRRKVSLGQMLGKQNADPSFDRQAEKENGQKLFSAKRKKFGFG